MTYTDHKVLVVDDELSIRSALEMFLQNKGIQVETASNGAEAIQLVEDKPFDLVITDIRMGNMSGIDLTKRIKEYNSEIPVILITAYPDVDNAIEAIKTGVNDYIIKPFNIDMLERTVMKQLDKKNTAQEIRSDTDYKKFKSDFLTRVAHEFGNPLGPIDKFLTLFLDGKLGKVSTQQKSVLESIYRNSTKLKLLVHDLNLLYDIKFINTPLNYSFCHIDEIFNDIISDKTSECLGKNLKISINMFDNVGEVECDRQKIARVIFHLIDNAIKYSLDRSEVLVEISTQYENGQEFLKVSVLDGAAKLDTEQEEDIFNQFYMYIEDEKYDNLKERGLGIGLTLCKVIIEAHGGKIWLDRTSDIVRTGNNFSFSIPTRDNLMK